MAKKEKTKAELYLEIEELHLRLSEAEETLDAIRSGAVDALVVSAPEGDQVYTLQGADHTYRVLVESMNEGALTLTEDGVIIYCNSAFANMASTAYGKLAGIRLREMISERDLDKFGLFWQNALLESATAELELKLNGGRLPVYMSCRTLLTDGVPSVFAVVTNISERKQAEKALREINETLAQRVAERTAELQAANASLQDFSRATLNLMDDALAARKQAEESSAEVRRSEESLKRAQEIAHLGSWELDLISNNLSWSDEVYRIFGLQPQEFGATYDAFLEAVHPEDRVAVDAAYSGSILDGKDSYEIEHRVVRKDTGEVRIVHEKCEHIRDASGKIIRSLGMVHDITEIKRAEEELRDSNEELTRFNNIAVGREIRMIELKNEINGICEQAGLPPRYSLDFEEEG